MVERPRRGTAERPLRIVVVGNSTTFLTVPPATRVDDDVYASWLPELLAHRGVHAHVELHARWHATAREVCREFEDWVRDPRPDLVVLNVGIVDAQARVVPTWLLRNTMTWLPGDGKVAHAYRRRVVPGLRERVRAWQRFAGPKVGLRGSRVRPVVFERAVTRIVALSVKQVGAHVLLLDIDLPNERLLHWMPGLDARVDAYNAILHRIAVATPEGRCRLVPTSQAVAVDPVRLLPDGIHRSGDGHVVVAAAIADAVIDWSSALGLDP